MVLLYIKTTHATRVAQPKPKWGAQGTAAHTFKFKFQSTPREWIPGPLPGVLYRVRGFELKSAHRPKKHRTLLRLRDMTHPKPKLRLQLNPPAPSAKAKPNFPSPLVHNTQTTKTQQVRVGGATQSAPCAAPGTPLARMAVYCVCRGGTDMQSSTQWPVRM